MRVCVVSGGPTAERRHQAGDNNIVKAGGLGGEQKTRDSGDGAMNHCLEKLKLKIIRRRCGLLYLLHTWGRGRYVRVAAFTECTHGRRYTSVCLQSGWYHFCRP